MWAGDGVAVVVEAVGVVEDASRCTLCSPLGGERPEADAGRFTPALSSPSMPSSAALFCRSNEASATLGTFPPGSVPPALPEHSPLSNPGPDEALILVASLSTMADRDPFRPRAAPTTAALPPAADKETPVLETDDEAEVADEDDSVVVDEEREDVDAADDNVCGGFSPAALLEPSEEPTAFTELLRPAPDLATGMAAASDDTTPTLGVLRPMPAAVIFTQAAPVVVVFVLLAPAPLPTTQPFPPLTVVFSPAAAAPAPTLLTTALPLPAPPLLLTPQFLTPLPEEVC